MQAADRFIGLFIYPEKIICCDAKYISIKRHQPVNGTGLQPIVRYIFCDPGIRNFHQAIFCTKPKIFFGILVHAIYPVKTEAIGKMKLCNIIRSVHSEKATECSAYPKI